MLRLETQNLIIRHFTLEDASFVLKMLNDPDFIRFVRDSGVRTIKDAQNYLKQGPLKSYQTHGFGLNCVSRKIDDVPAGMCGILKRDNLEHADIGFGFLPEFRGQSYALEASRAVIEHAQSNLGLNTLLAIVDPSNHRSVSLLEKLHFQFAKLDDTLDESTVLAMYVLRPKDSK